MRISRSTGAVSGLLIVLLGIWGGLIPFVGPYFHYAFGSDKAWHFTADRFWLEVLPGAVAVLGGLTLMVSADRIRATFGSWLAIIAGGWFVVGPAVSRIWEHAPGPIGGPLYTPVRQMAELVGYFYGLGAVIVALAAFALGRAVSRPSPVIAVAEPVATAEPASVAEPIPATEPDSTPEPVTAPAPVTFSKQPATPAGSDGGT